jgi:hypothetical protein
MTKEAKDFLKVAIAGGAVLTDLRHLLGPLSHKTIKEVNEARPWGHKTN